MCTLPPSIPSTYSFTVDHPYFQKRSGFIFTLSPRISQKPDALFREGQLIQRCRRLSIPCTYSFTVDNPYLQKKKWFYFHLFSRNFTKQKPDALFHQKVPPGRTIYFVFEASMEKYHRLMINFLFKSTMEKCHLFLWQDFQVISLSFYSGPIPG